RPVFNILEGAMDVILTNARDAKGYKARKTAVIDAEWLADLLRHGLLKPSFIPPPPIRALRELTRYRDSLVREQTALANRIQKLIESANSKLGQVASEKRGSGLYFAFISSHFSASPLTVPSFLLLCRASSQGSGSSRRPAWRRCSSVWQ
ncbi:MAG: transposase, partial [Deltaproteobacteria bacterium]|nr:transposase [Deltaproteobacteria bacterium]